MTRRLMEVSQIPGTHTNYLVTREMLCKPDDVVRFIISAVRQIAPFVRAATEGKKLKGGIYPIPAMYPVMKKESKVYKGFLPKPWQKYTILPSIREIKTRWLSLTAAKN